MMFFVQAEDGIRSLVRSRGLGDVYKRQMLRSDPDEGVRAAVAEALAGFVLDRELGRFDTAAGDLLVSQLKEVWEARDESVDVRARALESLGPRLSLIHI